MDDQQPEKDDRPGILTPPPLMHLGGIGVGYGLDQVLAWHFAIPRGLAILALVVALVGVALVVSAVITLHRHHTTVLPQRAASHLVTGGPFAISRNPIYAGFALLHLACGLSLGSPGILLMLLPVLHVMHHHVIAEEEAFHQRKFGEQWQAYSQRVRRWI